MKYFCLDRDSCGFTRKLNEEEFKTEDFSQPFKNCLNCNYYMILVPEDFSLNSLSDLSKSITATKKIYTQKEKKNDTNQ